MFLLIILFGVLVLSLAFLSFWQAEVQGLNHPKPDPPAAAAQKSAANATGVPTSAQPAAAPEEAPAATDPAPPEKSETREP